LQAQDKGAMEYVWMGGLFG